MPGYHTNCLSTPMQFCGLDIKPGRMSSPGSGAATEVGSGMGDRTRRVSRSNYAPMRLCLAKILADTWDILSSCWAKTTLRELTVVHPANAGSWSLLLKEASILKEPYFRHSPQKSQVKDSIDHCLVCYLFNRDLQDVSLHLGVKHICHYGLRLCLGSRMRAINPGSKPKTPGYHIERHRGMRTCWGYQTQNSSTIS